MSNKDDMVQYFDDALKIHAICADIHLSEGDARILTYMRAKALESGLGIEYFFTPAREDSEALEIMLGKSSIKFPSTIALDEESNEALELILTIADRISHIDNLLAQECGLENRLTGELRLRLRLYEDSHYRNKMINLYNTEIVPRLHLYDKEKIDDAFCKLRTEQELRDKEFMEMVKFPLQN